MIQIINLTKRFGNLVAVNKINFHIKKNENFGFLGPNGAGKTTTIKMICTILRPDEGEIYLNGYHTLKEAHKVRKSLGIIFQDPSLDNNLTVYENLYFHSKLYHIPGKIIKERIEHSLNLVNMIDRKKDLVRTLSGGMKRRIEIARGMLHSPQIFFLDEPTIGLDPQTRKYIWEYILELQKKENITLFLTTHYMEEAEYCDRIAIIDHGKIIACDTPANLKKLVRGDIIIIKTKNNKNAKTILEKYLNVEILDYEEELRLVVPDSNKFLPRVFKWIGKDILEADIKKTTLDDVFIHLTGRAIRDEAPSNHDRLKLAARMRRRI